MGKSADQQVRTVANINTVPYFIQVATVIIYCYIANVSLNSRYLAVQPQTSFLYSAGNSCFASISIIFLATMDKRLDYAIFLIV